MISHYLNTVSSKSFTFKITSNAVKQIKDLLRLDNENKMLRLKLKLEDCGDNIYNFTLESALKDGDKLFEQDSASVVLDSKTFQYLKDAELDYVQDDFSSYFKVNIPQGSEFHHSHHGDAACSGHHHHHKCGCDCC